MVLLRRRLLCTGLLVRFRRARGGLREHVGCGASMRGAVHSYSARCSKRSHGKASEAAEARGRWRLWRARGFCTAKEFCAAAAGRRDPYRILGPSVPWPGDPHPNPNRRGRFQRGRPGSGGAVPAGEARLWRRPGSGAQPSGVLSSTSVRAALRARQWDTPREE